MSARGIVEASSGYRPSEADLRSASGSLLSLVDWSGGDADSVRWQMGHGEEQDFDPRAPEHKEALDAWALGAVENAWDKIRRRMDSGRIRVWRVITAPRDWRPDGRHPGTSWSWDQRAAQAHWGDFRQGNVKWRMTAVVGEGDVDWPLTLALNADPSTGEDEKEIRLLDDVPVEVESAEMVR